jgi:hypothetical protein
VLHTGLATEEADVIAEAHFGVFGVGGLVVVFVMVVMIGVVV